MDGYCTTEANLAPRTPTDSEPRHLCFGSSKLFFQYGHGESFHHGPRRLCFDHLQFSEYLLLASLCRRLETRLDHAQAGDRELAHTLDLLRGDLSQFVHEICAFFPLYLEDI